MPVLPKDYEDLLIAAGKNPANYVYDRQNDTVVPIEPDEPGQQTAPGAMSTFAREAGVSVLPSLVAGAAGAYGAGAGARVTPEQPLIGGAIGALGGGLVGGLASDTIEQKALEYAAPEFLHETELGRAAHPNAAALGRFVGGMAGFGSPLRGIRSLVNPATKNAIGSYLANTGLQGALNLGTAAVTGNLGNMTGEEKRAMFFETLAGGLQHGGPLTRKIAAKYAPALNEYMKTGDKAGALTPEQRAAKMMESTAPKEQAKSANPVDKLTQVVPYTDEEIGVIMNADEWNPPNPTPHDKAISKGKAEGILQTPEDYTRILQSTAPDTELRGIYMQRHAEKQAQMSPEQRYAQSREAITEGELKAREEFKKQLEGFADERKSLDDEIKLLDETPIPPGGEGTRMAIKLQKVNKLKELMDRQLVAEQEYAARWPTPEQPFNPGPLPREVGPDTPPIDVEAYDQRLLPAPEVPQEPVDIPSSPFGPAIPLPERMPTPESDIAAMRAAGESRSPLERAKLSPDTTPLSEAARVQLAQQLDPTYGQVQQNAHESIPAPQSESRQQFLDRLRAMQAHGEAMSQSERERMAHGGMTVAEQRALQDYRAQMEGEQSVPFGADGLGIEAADVPPPTKVYGGLPISREALPATAEALDNFKRWFGNSVLRDNEGNPRVLYHITKADFDAFNTDPKKLHYSELGSHFGTKETISVVRGLNKAEGAKVLPVYLRLENPLHLPDIFPLEPRLSERLNKIERYVKDPAVVDAFREYYNAGKPAGIVKLKQQLVALGYDGIKYYNAAEGGGDSYIAFHPAQIKSAIGNHGTFDPTNPHMAYGGLPIHEPLQHLWEDVKALAKKANFKLEDITVLPLLWRFTKQTQSRFAEQNPLGAIVAANMPTLYHRRDKIAADKINTTELFKDFLSDDKVKEWLHNQTDGRTWDTSTLPKELQATGETFVTHIKSYIDEMIARGQKVMRNRGNAWEWRDPEHVDGYFPWAIDKKIWAEITEGGPKAAQRRKEWIDNWKKFNPGDEEADAEAAFDALIEPISAKRVIGGEPVFNQFRRTHGVPVPKEWRDNNVYESLQTYNRNYGVDAAWTEVVQSDPLMRRAFGIKRDQAGNDTSLSDKSARPTQDQWTAAFREADRVGARWAQEATPDMDLGSPLLDDNNGNARSLLATYSQRPMYAMTGIERTANAANQVAGAMMLQTLSGVRDVSQALASTAEYMTGPGKLAAVKALARSIVDPMGAIHRAEAAGAMQKDVFAHQGEEVLSRAVYKAVRGVRGMTGRNFLDQLGKAVTYSVAHDTVEWQLTHLGESPLAREFGPVGVTDRVALAEGAAAALVQRSSPSYDARNLPAWASPQTRSFLGHLFSLSTWGIARFNNWMVDSYLPMVRNGSFERFIASLGFGILGAAATQSLTSFIRQKKPADLSWQEWMGLSTEDQQKEFAPMLFALMQAQGTIGIAGDLAAPIVKAATGKTARLADIEPQMPAVIMGKDIIHTLADFATYAGQREHLDKYDVMDLIHELAKSVQLYRDLQKPLGIDTSSEENARERRIYEDIEKKSAVTGNAIAPPLFQFGPIEGGKFSLSKAFNQRGVGSGLEGLMPDLIRAAQQGRSVNVKGDKRTDDYYQNMARRVGLDDAKRTYERDVAETDEDQLRKQLASRLRSMRPR